MSDVVLSVYDFLPSELPMPASEPGYRRDQLANWLFANGVGSFAEMTNLPQNIIEHLSSEYRIDPFMEAERFPSRDGSVRYLFTLPDGKQTEAVYMPYLNRRTLCISSMVGCPAGCTFCATGALGFGRNLSQGEIVGQLLAVARGEGIEPRSIRNLVLMGMGEALLNYNNAMGAIRTFIDPNGLAMSPRRITISTVGLPTRMRKLADEGIPLVLAVSLHAPDEESRRKIIPTAHANTIDEIIAALHYWNEKIGRRITIEYTMLEGVNDHPWQAQELAKLLRGLPVHVNLIPFNTWEGVNHTATPNKQIEAFKSVVGRAGLNVSIRFSRGRDAGGACGQLALTQGKMNS